MSYRDAKRQRWQAIAFEVSLLVHRTNTPLILGDSDVRFTPKATWFSTNRDVRLADS